MNNNPDSSLLKTAVEHTDDVKGNFKAGLGAIKNNERQKFVVPDPRLIGGSLDIDSSTRDKYPDNFRWDYAVEYKNETFSSKFILVRRVKSKQLSQNWIG